MDITVYIFVNYKRYEILKRIESLTSLANQNAHIVTFHIDGENAGLFLILLADLNIHIHGLEDAYKEIVRGFLDLGDLFIRKLGDDRFLFGSGSSLLFNRSS